MSRGPRMSSSGSLSSIAYAVAAGMGLRAMQRAPGSRQEHGAAQLPSTRQEQAAESAARGWWGVLARTYAEVNRDRVQAVAGGVTFYGLLSLFPALTVLVSLYGLIADPAAIARHVAPLSGFLPQGALSIIGDQATRLTQASQSKLGTAAIIGLLVALWSANSAMKALMDALNIAYGSVEKRGVIKLNLVSLGFTVGAIVGFLVMIGVIAVIPAVLRLFNLGAVGDLLLWAGRWPVILVLIALALALLYQWGPSRPDVSWRWVTPGSILASVALVVFSLLFSWYAATFADYDGTYGSLGAAIGFLIWMWLSTTIVLVGAELNAEVERGQNPGPKPGGDAARRK